MTAPSLTSLEQESSTASADSLIRRLSVRYFFVLAAVATLVVVDQAVVQPLLVRMNSYAPAINLAGRQRMLSQRLTKAALVMQASSDDTRRKQYQAELRATLSEWTAAHFALHGSDQTGELPKLDSHEFNHAWAELQPHYEAMVTAGNILAGSESASDGLNNSGAVAPRSPPNDASSAIVAKEVSAIVDHEGPYLENMEKIVALLERDADRQVALLRGFAVSISAALIALLLGLGWYVIRPATRVIRRQVDRLEFQVGERTRQLALVNHSLRQEIAQRQAAEVKNHDLAAQLAHATRLSTMGQLTAALAHEINQPLATIANYADTCELDLADASSLSGTKLRRQIEHIKQAALRAGQIVRRIRNFVRPHRDTTLIEVDLNTMVAEVVELFRLEALRHEVQIFLQPSASKLAVSVDPIQIQQVLVNLLQNAVDAMKACSSDQRQVRISSHFADNQALVSVSDSGPGIEVDAELLFTPFATTKANGLGIGLSICRTLIEGHRGRIWVDTTDKTGTTICFSLPLIQDQDAGQSKLADCVCG